MKIVLTGNRGLLGQNLQPVLINGGHQVTGVDIQEADITKADQISTLITNTAPDLVIHAAALTDLKYCEQHEEQTNLVNATGTKNVASACRQSGCELLYISTDYVFGGEKKTPYLESDKTNPICVYARSKKAGEDHVAELVAKHYIVRTAGLYGTPGNNFIQAIFRQVREGNNLKVVNDEHANRTYAPDLAEAIVRLIPSHKYGIYHIANQGVCSWYEFALDALKLAGIDEVTTITPISGSEYPDSVTRPPYSGLSMGAYEAISGHKMRHYKQALKEYIKSLN